MSKNTLAERFRQEDSDRAQILETARDAASLTKPAMLPPKGHSPNHELIENYTSMGTRGVVNLEGRILLALFPPGQPWFELSPAPEIMYAVGGDEKLLNRILNELNLISQQMVAELEAANLKHRGNGRRTTFRSRKRQAISQLVITGDVLERLNKDMRLQVFRRDMYTTKRDSAGDVIHHLIKEQIDPLILNDQQLADAGLNKTELAKKDASERMMPIYTLVEWQPQTEVWLIRQEINDSEISEEEERISPYFSTPFELVPGEHYGRGFVEINMGELRSLNELEERRLDLLGLVANGKIVLDKSSQIREADLNKPPGSVLRGGKVRGGKAEDIGTLNFNVGGEFNMLTAGIQEKNQMLGAAFLLLQASQRDAERVTATERRQNAQELDGALGGMYAQIADDQQLPLLRRLYHVMSSGGKIQNLPEESIEITALTGLESLHRDIETAKVLQLTNLLAQFGPEQMQRIDVTVLIDMLARNAAIHVPGLIKSEETMQQERAQALQQQAAERTVDAAGDIAANVAPQLVGAA